jgi:hypothetical protein
MPKIECAEGRELGKEGETGKGDLLVRKQKGKRRKKCQGKEFAEGVRQTASKNGFKGTVF